MNKNRRNAGWISTLVALVALVVVGFLCGALAGFLWEEPGLVLAYLSGETESVEFSEEGLVEPGPVAAKPPDFAEAAPIAPDSTAVPEAKPEHQADEVAPKPLAPREEATEVARVAPPAPPVQKPAEKKPVEKPPAMVKPAPDRPAPTKVASVAPAGRFSVQVGAFADSATAEKLASRLRAKGYTTYVKADAEGSGKRFRVRVGPVNARARADELAAKLAKGEKLPTWVLDENKG